MEHLAAEETDTDECILDLFYSRVARNVTSKQCLCRFVSAGCERKEGAVRHMNTERCNCISLLCLQLVSTVDFIKHGRGLRRRKAL